MIQYEIEISNNKLHIKYFGELFKDKSEKVNIVYGYNSNWENTKMESMKKTENGFVIDIQLENCDILNFCFSNEYGIWDDNKGVNYSVYIVKNKEENMNCKFKDSGVLLISEIQDKVFLPFTAEEIEEIIQSEDNEYETVKEVIDNVFTKPFSYYNNQFTSRFRESVELVTKREKMTLRDGINLGYEMFGKRYLHPAIISACKNLDELNVYLDCLDKDELDDFKVFNICYEMHPLVIKNENNLFVKISIIQKVIDFIKKIYSKIDFTKFRKMKSEK